MVRIGGVLKTGKHVTDSTGRQIPFRPPTDEDKAAYRRSIPFIGSLFDRFGTLVRILGALALVLLVAIIAGLLCSLVLGLSDALTLAIAGGAALLIGGVLVPIAWKGSLRDDWARRRHEMSLCVACGSRLPRPGFRMIPDEIPHRSMTCPGCGGVWQYPTD